MQTDKRFVFIFLAIVLVLVFQAGAVNWLVDPFGKVHQPWFGMYYSTEREQKMHYVKVFPHNALLIGSSRTASIDPDDINCSGLTFFNASFSSALPEEILNYLEHYVDDAKVVVIGLDVFMFNESHREYTPDWEGRGDKLSYLFSADTLGYSWGTVNKWLKGKKSSSKPDGQRNMESKNERDAKQTDIDYAETLAVLQQSHYNNIIFSTRRIQVIGRIRDLMRERGVKTVFFWNPINVAILDMIFKDSSKQAFYQRAKGEVREVLPDIVDLNESRYSRMEAFYKFDPVHYYPATGACIVRALLATESLP